MRHKAYLATLIALAIALAPGGVAAEPLGGDHLIVPGARIGAAELGPADQGALVRTLGEPDQTLQRADRAYYMYGVSTPDGGLPDELVVEFDLAKDLPFEITTASPVYRTREGLGVGSSAADIHAKLGAPLCEGSDAAGDGLIVYGAIWFSTAHGAVTRVAIREHLEAADFKTGAQHC